MYQALYRKYRPRTFDDVVGQAHITETLKNQVRSDKLSHAYLFIGTRGTGKTTCAKILAKAVNCQHPVNGNPCNQCPACRGIDEGNIMDVVELDAASNNGVDHVRALRDEAIFSPAGVRKRVYIIDEVHMLSTAAFNALLKIMEEPPAHLMFILATTELKKVPATILSRCQRHTFKRIDTPVVAGRLRYVAQQEGLHMTDSAADLLGRLADGSMRDGLSLLDQVLGDGNITEESVLSATGLAGSIFTTELLKIIVSRDTAGALQLFHKLWNDGKDPALLLNELATLLRDVLLYLTAPEGCTQLLSGNFGIDTIRGFTGALGPATLMRHLEAVQSAQDKLKDSRNQRMTVELCLIGMCDPRVNDDVSALLARIEALERQLENGANTPPRSDPPVGASIARPPQCDAAPGSSPVPVAIEPSRSATSTDDRPPWDDAPAPAAPKRRPSFEEMMAGSAGPAPNSSPAPAVNEPSRSVTNSDDRPPWDDDDIPPVPNVGASTARPQPKAEPKPVGNAPDPNWQPFLALAERALPPFITGILPQCRGVFTDEGMVLQVPDGFPRIQLDTPNNVKRLQQCANDFYGKPVSFKLEAMAAGAPRAAARSLDDFKNDKFNDIVKFK